MHCSTARRTLAVLGLLAGAIAASLTGGTPDSPLPEVALSWHALLHVERGAAILLILGATFLVVWRATQGQFPIRFGNFLEFEATEKHTVEGREAVASLQEQIDSLRDFVAARSVENPHDRE
jgi:hypothetical protein